MKDWMLIFIGEDYGSMGLSPEQIQERMGRWMGWNQKMQEDGVVKGGHALHAPVTRVVGKDRTVTDLAAAEVKELVGGYYIVQAKTKEGAIEIAQGYPDYDMGGTVEVREVMYFNR